MHYYKFNIGDWHLHTSHLTLVEEAVYFRLVNHYYNTEKPFIKSETQTLIRRLRLGNESVTVKAILEEFFVLNGENYVHARCEKEIKTFKKKAKVNKANGAKGGRPPVTKGLEDNPEETQTVTTPNPNVTLNTNHKPLTTNQELLTNNNKPKDQKTMPGKPDVGQRSVIDYLNLKSSSNYQPVAANIKLISGRLAEGRTVEEIKQVIDRQCMEWPPDHHMRKYLRPKTLFNAEKFNQYFGQLGQPIITEQQNGQSQRPNQPVGEVARIHATIDARAKARLEALQSGWGGLHEGGAGLEEV